MIECRVIDQQNNVTEANLREKPSFGEVINLQNGSWGKVKRVEHFDGGRLDIYIDVAVPMMCSDCGK